MSIAYKILTSEQAEALRLNQFAGAPADLADGYIHLSTAEQVQATLDKHFAGQTGLWLAAVDLEACAPCLRWEVSRGGALFPHLYGQLAMTHVIELFPMRLNADGQVILAVGD